MLETGAGKTPLKKKESGGSSVRGAIKRRLTVHTSDVVDALDKIKSFSRGGYLLKIQRPPDKETGAEQHESVVVKWRAPIDHHTSDWIGIWPVGSKPVRKLGRVLASSSSEDTPTRSHSSQPVVGKCWAFVPKGKKGIITFSGDRLPTSEGKYCLNYVVEGDPWSEQSIAFSGPEFNISGTDSDKGSTALSPRQELKTSSGTSPVSPRSGSPGLTFSLSTEVPTVMDEEERHRAWREDWMAAVDEADQSRLIEWETGRILPRTGQTLAELTFKVPNLFRSLRHRGGSSSESESEDGDEDSLAAEDSATEESDSTKRRKRKEQERMLKMKSEGGMLDIWRRTSRGKRETSLLKSSSETEPEGGEPASHSLASAVSFNVVPTISTTESDDILGGEPAKHDKLRRGGSLRRKKHDLNLIHSSPSSIPVFQVTPPSSFSEASESHTVPSSPSGSFIVLSSPSSSLSPVPTIGDNENAQVLPSGGGEPTKSSKKKKKKGSSSVKTAASNEVRSPLLTTNMTTTTTTTTTQTTSVPASGSSGDVVVRPAAQRETDASLASMPRPPALKSDIGSEQRVTPSSDADSRAKPPEQEQGEGSRRGRKAALASSSSANKVGPPGPTPAGGEDLFGVRKRYQVEIGPVIFSEDFVFYFLIFALIVFIIFHNALHELRLLLPASNK